MGQRKQGYLAKSLNRHERSHSLLGRQSIATLRWIDGERRPFVSMAAEGLQSPIQPKLL